jgi:MYXO-CTERM domain-containing protein
MKSSRPLARASVRLVAVAVLLSSGLGRAADTSSSARPPALEGRTGCELWVGKVSGNDPSVLVEALLCEGMNGEVSGQLQWSSLESGYSIRDIAGRWQGKGTLSLHDTKMTVSKPNPGWVFCTVDSYDLVRTGDQLNGSYTSRKCNDRASVALTKKAAPPPVIPAPSEIEPAAPDRANEDERAPERRQRDSSCACETPHAAPSELAAAAPLALLALVSLSRRRSRCRAAKPRASW